MNKDNILKAWDLVKNDTKVKKFYFLPWIISILFLMVILVYQVIYTYVVLFHQKDKALGIILDVFHSGYIVEILTIWGIFLLMYLFIMPIFEWGLIWYISQKSNGHEHVSLSDSIGKWMYHFLPMFEYGNLVSEFKLISVVNMYLFCLRFIGVEFIELLNYGFLFLLIISTLINIFFVYCRFEIVLNNKKAFESFGASIKIVLMHLSTTIKTYFFLFLVNVRLLLNLWVFLFFPIIIASAVAYITTKIFLLITVVLLSILFVWFIIVLWYIGGVFDVFKITVWYNAYIEGKQKIASMDAEKSTN